MMTGDFNDIFGPSEKSGGNPVSWIKCDRFRNAIESCGLMDIEGKGPQFTWAGTVNVGGRVMERLDRVLATPSWTAKFPDIVTRVLPRTHSDHNPILTDMRGLLRIPEVKPFRFELAWKSHPNCKDVISSIWDPNRDLLGALNTLPETLRDWNRSVFGNVFRKKRLIKARLGGLQKIPIDRLHDELRTLETQLIRDYNEILREEEMIWFQKSIIDWLKFGDRNTKFFHLSTLNRRRRNKIDTLLVNDTWETDRETLKEHVRD